MTLINDLGFVYHQYWLSSYLDYPRQSRLFVPLSAMEIKFELDTDKAARATVSIAASYGLGQVSEGTGYPQLTFANAIALIIIIAILYSTCPPRKLLLSNLSSNFLQFARTFQTLLVCE